MLRSLVNGGLNMTNEEFYKDKIFDAVAKNLAISKDGEIATCKAITCENCIFKNNIETESCIKKMALWLKQEYVEQVDWSKIKVDTPIYVRDCETDSNGDEKTWVPRHFAKFENGTVYAWDDGGTSFTVKSEDSCSSWNYAKLAESEETVWQRSELQKN